MKFHKLVLGAIGTNCYIVADENTNEAIVFDAPDRADIICDFLNENNYTVKDIILTHGHYDHILALGELKKCTKAPISIHRNDAIFLEDASYNLCHYLNIDWNKVEPDKILEDGDIIKLNDIEIRVIHTPGHTAGCLCFLVGDILISGDTLFYRSVGRTDHPTGDLNQEVKSIKEKIMILSDDIKVYPGHGEPTTIGEERKENPYLI